MPDDDGFAEDLDRLAEFGWGTEAVDRLARSELSPGQLAAFVKLDDDARRIVLAVLDGRAGEVQEDLERRSDRVELARWMLTLPALRDDEDEDEDEDEDGT